MKALIWIAFLFLPALATANGEKPQFPTSFPKTNFDMSKVQVNVEDSFEVYCGQEKAIKKLQGDRVQKELKFMSVVCKNGQLIGVEDAGLDANTAFLVKFEIVLQGLSRIQSHYQQNDQEPPLELNAEESIFRDYSDTAMIGVFDKAYNPNGNVDIYSLRGQISQWVSAITEWYMNQGE